MEIDVFIGLGWQSWQAQLKSKLWLYVEFPNCCILN